VNLHPGFVSVQLRFRLRRLRLSALESGRRQGTPRRRKDHVEKKTLAILTAAAMAEAHSTVMLRYAAITARLSERLQRPMQQRLSNDNAITSDRDRYDSNAAYERDRDITTAITLIAQRDSTVRSICECERRNRNTAAGDCRRACRCLLQCHSQVRNAARYGGGRSRRRGWRTSQQ